MLRKIIAVATVAGLAVACLEEAVDSSELENMDQGLSVCTTQAGLHPGKAALAVAMATEMKAWKPLEYLEVVSTSCSGSDGPKLRISAAGEAACQAAASSTTTTTTSCVDAPPPNGGTCEQAVAYNWCGQTWMNGTCAASCGLCTPTSTTTPAAPCANTRAILALTDRSLNRVVDQSVFNAVSFCEDLVASFNRQRDLIADLSKNAKSMLPPAKYTLDRKMPTGACGDGVCSGEDATTCPEDCVESCGSYYRYGATVTEGNVDNLIAELCFFGQDHPRRFCGGNPYVAFRATSDLAFIDPVDGDLSGGTTGAADCLALNAPDIQWGSASNLGKCCSYPNPNKAGEFVNGELVAAPTSSLPQAQKCSLPGSKWYDPPTPKFANLYCHYLASGVLKQGKFTAWGTTGWDLCR